jgi:hypothetical protein
MPPGCSIKNVVDRGSPNAEGGSKLLSCLASSQAAYLSNLLCRKLRLVMLFTQQHCAVSVFVQDIVMVGFPRQMNRVAAKRLAALMRYFMFFGWLLAVDIFTNNDVGAKLFPFEPEKGISAILVVLPNEAITAAIFNRLDYAEMARNDFKPWLILWVFAAALQSGVVVLAILPKAPW